MPTYLDTSAVLRLVEQRGDLGLVHAAMADDPLSSTLTELECWTAIHKKWHDGAFDEGERNRLLATADGVLRALNLLKLDEDVLAETRVLVQRYPLRTLDAIHLASAARVQERLAWVPGGMRFCTADRRQADAAVHRFGATQVDLVPPWL